MQDRLVKHADELNRFIHTLSVSDEGTYTRNEKRAINSHVDFDLEEVIRESDEYLFQAASNEKYNTSLKEYFRPDHPMDINEFKENLKKPHSNLEEDEKIEAFLNERRNWKFQQIVTKALSFEIKENRGVERVQGCIVAVKNFQKAVELKKVEAKATRDELFLYEVISYRQALQTTLIEIQKYKKEKGKDKITINSRFRSYVDFFNAMVQARRSLLKISPSHIRLNVDIAVHQAIQKTLEKQKIQTMLKWMFFGALVVTATVLTLGIAGAIAGGIAVGFSILGHGSITAGAFAAVGGGGLLGVITSKIPSSLNNFFNYIKSFFVKTEVSEIPRNSNLNNAAPSRISPGGSYVDISRSLTINIPSPTSSTDIPILSSSDDDSPCTPSSGYISSPTPSPTYEVSSATLTLPVSPGVSPITPTPAASSTP